MLFVSHNLNGVTKQKLNALLLRAKTADYPHIIAIQECKRLLTPTLGGYFSISDLTHSQHGVALYLRRDVRLLSTIFRDHNMLAIYAEVDGAKYVVVNIYNPFSQRSELPSFSEKLLAALANVKLDESTCTIIAGDFNYDLRHKNLIEYGRMVWDY